MFIPSIQWRRTTFDRLTTFQHSLNGLHSRAIKNFIGSLSVYDILCGLFPIADEVQVSCPH